MEPRLTSKKFREVLPPFFQDWGDNIKKARVFLNEQHSLLPEQERILEQEFDEFEISSIPAQGWTLDEMREVVDHVISDVVKQKYESVVFASPVPFLVKELAVYSGDDLAEFTVKVFHNNQREKKELPNGKVVYTVAKEGWQLV